MLLLPPAAPGSCLRRLTPPLAQLAQKIFLRELESMVVRTYEQECAFVKQVDGCSYSIGQGFVDGMRVPGHFYVNEEIKSLLFDELKQFSRQVCSHVPVDVPVRPRP